MKDKRDLSELIARLPTRADDEVASVAIEGHALSKSDASLHLALRTGLVAVPINSIVRVTTIPGTKGMVRLVVRNPGGIQQLLSVRPAVAAQVAGAGTPFDAGGAGPAVQRGERIGSGIAGPGVSTCDYYDTETATGEEGFDTSDDEEPDCHDDDEPE